MKNQEADDFPSLDELSKHIRAIGFEDTSYYSAEDCAKDILNLPSPFKKQFLHWWKTNEIKSDITVKGVNVEHIVKYKNWDPSVAFTLMAQLYQNPDDYQLYRYLTHNRAFL